MNTIIKFFVAPGSKLPVRNEGDIGYDLFVRAIVGMEHDKKYPFMRGTVFDFTSRPGTSSDFLDVKHIVETEGISCDYGHILFKYGYVLHRDESIPIGFGVFAELPPDCAGYVVPRGSTIRKIGRTCRLEIANSAVPIDPSFRGEFYAELVNHGPSPFVVLRDMCLAQLVVHRVAIKHAFADSYHNLASSTRGSNCHGSTRR